MKQVFLWIFIIGLLTACWFRMGAENPFNNSHNLPSENSREKDKGQIIEHFELEGFDDDGNREWELEGDSAHVDENHDVFIEKNVLLTLTDGAIIRADKVFWQATQSRFITNQPVKIDHSEIEVTGRGALGNLDQKMVQINQDIRMIIEPGTIVTSRGPMRIYQNENRISLYRDVWILDERGAVSADRMDGYFDTEDRQLTAVIARGNVRISQGDDVTYTDIAVYDTVTGSVRFEGSPEIEIRSKKSLDRIQEGI